MTSKVAAINTSSSTQRKSSSLSFMMLQDVAQGWCVSDAGNKKNKALGYESSSGTVGFVQAPKKRRWKNITPYVEGDADRFACEIFFLKKDRKAKDKRAAQGKNIKDERNSGCDWPKLWQVQGKLVGSELTARSANKVLGKLPEIDILGFKYSDQTQE